MFILELYDRLGNKLNLGDIVKVSDGRGSFQFFAEVKYLEEEKCLTPTECARLQTIPEWYRWECSDTQAYRMLGNGWTNEVIKHMFSYLPKQLTSNEQQ